MLKYQDIRRVHLEVTTHCNARCPLCLRNFHGADHNDGYPLTSLSLDDIKTIFPVSFVQQLRKFHFGGNFGDFIMAKDIISIVEYLRSTNPTLEIMGSTNAGIRNEAFWKELAKLKMLIIFCIDGIGDTHSLYRIDTAYQTVIQNAKTFIDAGGHAFWFMTEFDHNINEIPTAESLAKEMGFLKFQTRDYGRNNGPVFSRTGEPVDYIGKRIGTRIFTKDEYLNHTQQNHLPKTIKLYHDTTPSTKFNCEVTQHSSIYVDALGDVYPCCYIGHYPKTFNTMRIIGNEQITELVSGIENNALTHGIEHAIGWFDRVSERFDVSTFDKGRLYRCHENCGIDK